MVTDSPPPIPESATRSRASPVAPTRRRRAHAAPRPVRPAAVSNLPLEVSSFVGRETDLSRLVDLLTQTRLLTLTGPGGIGKTRLAMRLADRVLRRYVDGVHVVELAPLGESGLVVSAVAARLGVYEQAGVILLDTVIQALRSQQLLLVLDNCEHVVGACANLAHALLRACVGLRVLATSREPLVVEGETVWRVQALTIPQRHEDLSVADLREIDAPRLFIERASAAEPSLELTARSAAAVVEICERLDGIPLAIELAAARVNVLSPEEIAERLEDRLQLLTGGSRTAAPRHQTLRAAMDWSYALLPPQEQLLFDRLSVFSGSWTLGAAEAVCADDELETDSVLELLAQLVRKSLVVVDEQGAGTRYRLLETLRQFGLEHLRASRAESTLRARHCDRFLAIAERSWPTRLVHRELREGLARVEWEEENLRSALAWSQQEPNSAERNLRLVGVMYRYWWRHGNFTEGREWLAAALARGAGTALDAPLQLKLARARALNGAGVLARAQTAYSEAQALFEESLALFTDIGDRWGIANALHNLGHLAFFQNDDDRAVAFEEQSLAQWRSVGDPWGICLPLGILAAIAAQRGDYERARALVEESLALARDRSDTWTIASRLGLLGVLVCEQGEAEHATRLLVESLAPQQAAGERTGYAWTLNLLGWVSRDQGDTALAESRFKDSLALFRQMGNTGGVAGCLDGLAGLLAATDAERATNVLATAHRLHETTRHLWSHEEQTRVLRDRALVAARLGDEAFARAWAAGQALPLELAIELAQTPGHPPVEGARQEEVGDHSPLTRRESDVASLVGHGLTNRQIAEHLVVSERTVATHIGHILEKLDFSSRLQVGLWAAQHGLVTG
jgi:predicted ATPase/DNA-binding CsgD family transcriptional regulator